LIPESSGIDDRDDAAFCIAHKCNDWSIAAGIMTVTLWHGCYDLFYVSIQHMSPAHLSGGKYAERADCTVHVYIYKSAFYKACKCTDEFTDFL